MRDWGIKRRVLFIALLPAFLASILLAGYLIFTQLRDLDKTLKERGFALVRQLGPASEYGVFSGSSEILRPLVSSVINEPDVRSIVISNINDEILASAGTPAYTESVFKGDELQPVSIILRDPNSMIFRAPIIRSEFVIDRQLESELQILEQSDGDNIAGFSEPVIGWITVEFDLSRTISRRNQLFISSLLLTLLVLGISIVLAIRLARDVSQPIVALTDTARRVESGQLDKPIHITAGGELGKLASGMNAMISALREAQSELQDRVDQATQKYKDALNLLERKNDELDNARKLAEAANNAKSEFLANVSHEIRNPLNAVLGFIGLLSKSELSEQQYRYVHTIDVSARNLLRIISDLLDLSRIEAGKMSLDYRVFSVKEMLSDIVALHMPSAEAKGLQLLSQVDEELPEFEEGDPVRIGQVLSNLIGNAIKFTESGQIEVSCIVRENVKRRLVLEFAVSDTGPGIEPEHQAYIYESFYQADNSTKRTFEGTGLGLAIAKKLIELMGGIIGLESTPGVGTRIWFTAVLTVSHNQELDVSAADEGANRNVGNMVQFNGNLRVLVVDDNEINRNLASTLMATYGIQVDEADSAGLAIEKIKGTLYDLVLMDVHMPKMDGVEATREIRKLEDGRGEIPVVALTADVVTERRKHFLEAGMNDYLAKPVEEHALISILLKWCPQKVKPGKYLQQQIDSRSSSVSVDQTSVLDSELGLRYSSGKESVWKKSLSLLLEKQEQELERLDKLEAANDLTAIAEIAHSLKGSANYCGAVAFGQAAEALETTARGGELEHLADAIHNIQQAAVEFAELATNTLYDGATVQIYGDDDNGK